MMWSAFILGLVGSLHCAAMCGPLMLGLSVRHRGQWFALLTHHTGRWVGYALLAVVFQLLIAPVYLFKLQQYIGLIAGLLLVVFALKNYIKPVKQLFAGLSRILQTRMTSVKGGPGGNFTLGVLNGLLPCGLSFGAAILSMNTGSWYQAISYMGLFALGTLPVLVAISVMPRFGKGSWLKRMQALTPKVLILTGLILILRSAGLGIPYVSPSYNVEEQKTECCHPE